MEEEENRKRKKEEEEEADMNKRIKENESKGEKRKVEGDEEDEKKRNRNENGNMEIDNVDKDKIRILDMGKHNLNDEESREEIKNLIMENKVDLLISNEAINYIKILQNYEGKGNDEFKERIKKIRKFVNELCDRQERNCR